MSLLERVEAARREKAAPAAGTPTHRALVPTTPDDVAPVEGESPAVPQEADVQSGAGLPGHPPPHRRGHRRRPGFASRPVRPGRYARAGWPARSTTSSPTTSRENELQPHPRRAAAARRRASSTRSPASGPSSRCWRTDSITEVMVNGPNQVYIERAGKIEKMQRHLPQRRARAQHHRPHHHAAGPAHRRDQPPRRCAPARRLPRQRHHQAALAWSARSSPSASSPPASRSRTSSSSAPPRRRCSTSSRPASRRASTSSSPAAPVRARRPRSTCSPRSSPRRNASSPSRMPRSCSSASATWSRSRRALPTSRAPVRSPSATCCATPCTCGPTASWWASAVPARRWT